MSGNHGVGCRCAECALVWDARVAAMKELFEIGGLLFWSVWSGFEYARLLREGARDVFKEYQWRRFQEADQSRIEELLSIILD
jgi:hypothetical protein